MNLLNFEILRSASSSLFSKIQFDFDFLTKIPDSLNHFLANFVSVSCVEEEEEVA